MKNLFTDLVVPLKIKPVADNSESSFEALSPEKSSYTPFAHSETLADSNRRKGINFFTCSVAWFAFVITALSLVYALQIRINYDLATTLRLWLTLICIPPALNLGICLSKGKKAAPLLLFAIALITIHFLGIGIVNNNPGIGSN